MGAAGAAPAKKWAREYETIYILRPDVDNDTAEKIVERAKDVIARLDGTLTKLDNWGKRKLAYPIQKNSRGIFVYLKYVGFSDLVAELERNLRLLAEVMRFQTVLLEEDVDPESVTVDPEELQYLHVEAEEGEEAEDAELERARNLGMAPRAPREPSEDDESDSSEDDDSGDDDDDSDSDTDNEADTDSEADDDTKAEADSGADADADSEQTKKED
jgi:small subunit ribosomal protein S6